MTGSAESQIQRLEAFLELWEQRFAKWEAEARGKSAANAPVPPTPEEILDHWVRFTPYRATAASRCADGSPQGEAGNADNPSLDLLDAFLSGDG